MHHQCWNCIIRGRADKINKGPPPRETDEPPHRSLRREYLEWQAHLGRCGLSIGSYRFLWLKLSHMDSSGQEDVRLDAAFTLPHCKPILLNGNPRQLRVPYGTVFTGGIYIIQLRDHTSNNDYWNTNIPGMGLPFWVLASWWTVGVSSVSFWGVLCWFCPLDL